MDRGALIGGIAVVAVMAVLAAGFVMVGFGGSDDIEVPEVGPRRIADDMDPEVRNWKKQPTVPGKPREIGDPPEAPPVVTDDGVERKPNPQGAGAEVWAQRMETKRIATETRARGVVDAFNADKDPETAGKVSDIIDHLFSASAAIRDDMRDGNLTNEQGRKQLADLRSKTMIDMTELLGGDDLATLRTELRRADATLF